jgi:acyl-CoA synthetase (AMP-forming)/AMP-acid ligase II
VLRVGGVLSPANPLYTAYEIKNQLKDSGASLVIAHPMCLENAKTAIEMLKKEGDGSENMKFKVLVLGKEGKTGADPFDALKGTGAVFKSLGSVADDQLAVLPYSSGTTGLPKGTMLSHRNMVIDNMAYIYIYGFSVHPIFFMMKKNVLHFKLFTSYHETRNKTKSFVHLSN